MAHDLRTTSLSADAWVKTGLPLLDGMELPTGDRAQVAVSVYDLCIEHFLGIRALIAAQVGGSAMALYRPQFEAYVRATWLSFGASDSEISRFLRGKEPPKIDQMLATISKAENGDAFGNYLTEAKAGMWRNACNYTHGGHLQAKSRIELEHVRRSFDQDLMAQLLDAATMLSFLAAVGMCAVADDQARAQALHAAYTADNNVDVTV